MSEHPWQHGGRNGWTSHGSSVSERQSDEMPLLEQLLHYELRCAARYRRFTTLVLVGQSTEAGDIQNLLGDTLRTSDQLMRLNGSAAILMGETDGIGALSAVARYRQTAREEGDLRFALASYPTDVRSAAEMLLVARNRLRDAMSSNEPGCIVNKG